MQNTARFMLMILFPALFLFSAKSLLLSQGRGSWIMVTVP